MVCILLVPQHAEESLNVVFLACHLHKVGLVAGAVDTDVLPNQCNPIILDCRHDFLAIFGQIELDPDP